ncbi:hypothetical protein K438DRAFT_1938534 [Mycena galopus ATCC 62051]|nr:hypothetical protein K438DRAFT_1938534 [Mycena galopus ATCC 62051]
MPKSSNRRSLLTLLSLALWSANGSQVNVTVDDFDPSIVYTPTTSWNSSQVVCSACENPPMSFALQQTYHKGFHVVVLDTDDDMSQSSSGTSPPPSASPAGNTSPSLPSTATSKPSSTSPPGSAISAPPIPSPPSSEDDDGKPDDDNDDDDKTGKKRPNKRNIRVSRLDSDDPGFKDTPVSAQYNFTGTAVYVFCIQPLGMSVPPASPSLMNVTFSLDSVPEVPFVHQGSPSESGFSYQVNVFAKQGLSDGPHELKLNLAPNSVFILDYLLITQNVGDNPSGSETSSGPAQSLPAQSIPIQSQLSAPSSTSGETKSGRASFAGAVAGSLGVLGILCFGTAFSLYRRRRLAARRERLERGNAPPLAPMSGPATFVPRYFPGTVIPSNPPPYAPSDASSSRSHASQIASSEPLLAMHPEQMYEDTVLAPPLDDAPPSFGVALTAPAVTLLSSSDVATPPPRPASWGANPHIVPLPPSISPESQTTSLYSAEDDHV